MPSNQKSVSHIISADSRLPYGPNNPHPLSTLKTELVWEEKYDVYGNRREVDVAGCAMPMSNQDKT